MKLNIRKLLLKKRTNSNILNNKCVYRVELKIIKVLFKTVNFVVVERNV